MKKFYFIALMAIAVASCKKEPTTTIQSKDINAAEKVSVDRFSSLAGHLMVRDASNGLPSANAAISFDKAPFITKGFGRSGASSEYYNFDVQPLAPANIYVFFKNGASTPITGQNNVINTLPGEAGYNDFWVVNKVIVPDSYVPNSLTSEAEIIAAGHTIQKTTSIVNCPVVPFGSTAAKKFGGGAQALSLGWYKSKAVAYFSFVEKELVATAGGLVPVSPIYVMFNDNNKGPASGFRSEEGTSQTHNVLATSPSDASYSPLWNVVVLNNSAFATVMNVATASAAPVLNPAAAQVNCPVVN